MSHCSEFWDGLAQFHAEVEDTNFDLASVRRLIPEIKSPVLVVGAGQGLIVAELRKQGFECEGVDLHWLIHHEIGERMALTESTPYASRKAVKGPASDGG